MSLPAQNNPAVSNIYIYRENHTGGGGKAIFACILFGLQHMLLNYKQLFEGSNGFGVFNTSRPP